MVEDLPGMQGPWFDPCLGQEDSLEKEMATHSSILAWRIPMDREDWWAIVHRVAKSQTQLRDFTSLHYSCPLLPVEFNGQRSLAG